MDGYLFACPIQVRWRDVDALGHVNNATIVTYLETARTELWRERFGGGEALIEGSELDDLLVRWRRA